MIEYRYHWSASSNISFQGESDWMEWWGDEDATPGQVEEALTSGRVDCDGLTEVLEACGFEWGVDTREVASAAENQEAAS